MRGFYADARHHERLMTVVTERLGHELAARAEAAKIAVADGGARASTCRTWSATCASTSTRRTRAGCARRPTSSASSARRAKPRARRGSHPDAIDALYFTGGSTGLRLLAERIAAAFPAARAVRGDRFASVATGLGVYAQRWFGAR